MRNMRRLYLTPFRYCRAAAALAIVCFTLIATVGCQKTSETSESSPKPPKPVSVMKLSRTKQVQRQLITGTIAPWKTEQIGFEVSGRVSFVIEQNDEVQPVLPSAMAGPPTPLAKIDPERLQIALATAKSDKLVAERRLEANRVAIDQRIPAAIESAVSEQKFAEAEFNRAKRLKQQNVIPESEFDAARNRFNVADSALASAKAELAQTRAEQATLESQVRRADEAIEEAERNLRNTTLYSSFRGIVAEVHAVPGSFVNPGDPVATVQMMDPMLVQFEVSPKDSRDYAKGDILDVIVTDSAGNREISNGMVYTVDAVADPDSRTYTVTLHIRNSKESVVHSASNNLTSTQIHLDSQPRTRRVYSLDVGPVITGGQQQLIEQSCLHKIGDDTVIWKITNRKANEASNPNDRVLQVEPIKVTVGSEEIVLLGQWNFVPVEFLDPELIDIKTDLVTGKLFYPEEIEADSTVNPRSSDSDPWAQRSVLLEQQTWALRSGDVVQVVKSGGSLPQGFFIPMKAILNNNGRTFLHVVETSEQGDKIARRVDVNVQNQSSFSGDAIRVEVQPRVAGTLVDGMQIVVGGSHYLSDGSRVNVVDGDAL